MYVETYPNEGPLWPCGCLVGDPNCRCGTDNPADEPLDVEVTAS